MPLSFMWARISLKQPYFLKEKDLRRLEVKEKVKELKQTGGAKNYIEKRRRRLANKDRKLLPGQRLKE